MILLTLEMPEELLQSVQELAAQRGEDVNEFCLQRLRAEVEAEKPDGDVENDPFWKAAGCFDSGVPDLAEHHDFYLAETIADDHENE